MSKRSILDKPSPGWYRDLPRQGDEPDSISVDALEYPPNHIDANYLEIPRSTVWGRELVFYLGLSGVIALFALVSFMLRAWDPDYVGPYLICWACIGLLLIGTILLARLALSPPRDEPIRFNRSRRRVFVYRFHHSRWNPFGRARWGVRPQAYDWDDLRAEQVCVYVPTVAYNNSVNIVVVEPGTNKVRDRFVLSHNGAIGANYWAIAQTFMQQGPEALPKFDRPPRDWNNEDPGWNLARRFAPKVQWPAAMDIESRSAP